MPCPASEWSPLHPAADLDWAKRRPGLTLLGSVLTACFLAFLWRTHYPTWRIVATVGVLIGIGVALYVSTRTRRYSAAAKLSVFPLLQLSVTFTGGMHSPLLLGTVGLPLGLFIMLGWTGSTRAMAAWTLAWALCLGLLPQSWFGPLIPDPYYGLISALAFCQTFAMSVDQLVILARAVDRGRSDLFRARERMATEAQARARELELMGSKLSHELKNPLGAIKMLVQLSKRTAGDGEALERLEVVESELDRMHGILQGYLSFSRPLEPLHFERKSLAELADEVLSVFEGRALAEGVSLHRSGDVQADVDATRFAGALLNLVANALEASPRGGDIRIAVCEADGKARVSIQDSGRGMSPEVLKRIGEPFFTTRSQGTGLGVLLARTALVQHGGTLDYASEPGRGTTATATLPLRAERTSDGATAVGR